jgi:iron complex outermembrane receptor protein
MEMEQFFGKVHYKFTDERYYTYLNEGSVDGFSMLNVALGYRLGNMGWLKSLTAQIDVTNVLEEDYISTVGSGGFVNADPNGTAQTLLPGAPRQWFFTLKAAL